MLFEMTCVLPNSEPVQNSYGSTSSESILPKAPAFGSSPCTTISISVAIRVRASKPTNPSCALRLTEIQATT